MLSAVKYIKQLLNVNQMANKQIFIKRKQENSNYENKHSTGTWFLKHNYTSYILLCFLQRKQMLGQLVAFSLL